MNPKLYLTTYLAGAIEANPDAKKGKEGWKQEIKKLLLFPNVGIYDPVEREAQKTGKPSGEHVHYVTALKQSGHWVQFYIEMGKIWWGNINAEGKDKLEIMLYLRNRFLIDGNELRDLDYWGDIEAVIRSNFIIVYLPKDTKTIGTIREVTYAELFNIPIYLVLPDQTKTNANSTLIDMVKTSGGETFYSVKECADYIKENYKLKKENQ